MSLASSRAIFFGLLFLILFLAGCSSEQGPNQPQDFNEIPRTTVDSLQSVFNPQETIISSVSGLDVLSNGNLVILDTNQKKVMLFHPDGEKHDQFGRAGKGPGEFVAPRGIDAQNSSIRILDIGLQRVNEYGLDGTFIQNYSIEREASHFGFVALGDSMEYYTVANGRNGKLVGYRNAATDSVGYFGDAIVDNPPPVGDQKAFKNSVSNGDVPEAISNDIWMDHVNGRLYVFLKNHSRLQKYRDGELRWDIHIEHPANEGIFEDFVEDVQSGQSAFGILRYIEDIDATGDHVYLLWNSSPQTVVQVSSDGNIQHVYELPKKKDRNLSSLAMDSDNDWLYLADGNGARVYKLQLN